MASPHIAVVDTDVYSALYVDPKGAARRGKPVDAWRDALAGMRVLIAFQTRAEVLAGGRAANWGEGRFNAVVRRLDSIQTVPADRSVIDAYATLTAACRRAGHALHDKVHTGDRWIAACAVAKDLRLLSGDRIYESAPGLTLL